MKKLLLGIFLTVLLSAGMVNAATVNVYFDASLDLTKIHGFGFDVDDVSLSEVTMEKGSFDNAFMWSIEKYSGDIYGYDYTDGNFNLSAGLVLSLTTADTAFTLSKFYLCWSDPEGIDMSGNYPLPYTVLIEETAEGIINYTYAAAVPVPSSLFLLVGGLCSLLGIIRKKKYRSL